MAKKKEMAKKMACSNCKGKGCKICKATYPDYNEGEKMMSKGNNNRQ